MGNHNRYCLVCGYDFGTDNKIIEYQSLCPCCLFHYGFDEIGNIAAFWNYRNNWLKIRWNILQFNKVNIFTKSDLLRQLKNINKIEPRYYYFGENTEAMKNYNIYDIDQFNKKWDNEFGEI